MSSSSIERRIEIARDIVYNDAAVVVADDVFAGPETLCAILHLVGYGWLLNFPSTAGEASAMIWQDQCAKPSGLWRVLIQQNYIHTSRQHK